MTGLLLLFLVTAPLGAERVETVRVPLQARAAGAFLLSPQAPLVVDTVAVDGAASWTATFGSFSPTLSIALIAPSGARRSTAGGDAELLPGQDDLGMDYVFEVPAPEPGLWSVEISDAAGTSSPRAVFFDHRFDSPIRLAFFGLAATVAVDEDLVLTAFVDDGSQVRTGGLAVTGSVHRQGDRGWASPPLSFRDDGQGADETAADGLWTATVRPGAPGDYLASVAVSGQDGAGHPFRRTADVTFRVVDDHARLDGGIADRGLDTNGNGRFEQLEVEIGVEVRNAGTYAARVTLASAGGNALYGRASGALAAGAGRSLSVGFDAADLLEQLAEDGPWSVSEVQLERVDGPEGLPVVVSRLYDLGSTGGYALTDLERDGIVLLDGATFEGVDTNGNGKFERLDITLPLALVDAGSYTYSAFLRLPEGGALATLDSGSSTVSLAAGVQSITLSFDGSAIGANGLDSPYELQGLLVFGAGDSLLRIRVLSLDGLAAGDFEGSGGGGVCPPVRLVAAKTYEPSRWFPDEEFFASPIEFALPDELPVTDGNAGNHRSYVRYRLDTQDLVNCVYQGGSAQAHPDSGQSPLGLAYSKFIGCFSETSAFPSGSSRLPISRGDVVTADWVRINVYNGDSNLGRTEITVDIDPLRCN